MKAVGLLLLALCLGATQVHGQGCAGGSCFPSTGNLLVGRGHMLNSSSTCGQRGPEPYCIVSHLKDVKKCFTCDAEIDSQAHPIQNVITTFDDDETWWQSEHGRQNVVVQLDLEAEFQFTHTIMIFKTFRPAAMFIERSMDFGENWAIYRYFASDCERSFPDVPIWPPKEVDQVVCDSRYSAIEPSEGGEVIFRVLEPFIAIDDPYAPRIQNLLKITNLRYNFTELHTLGDDLLDNRRDIKNKYYYSLKELIVRGNCFCYGHADSCSPIEGVRRPDEETSKIMVHGRCECQHNTMGLNCELCKPFYQDQPWRPAEEGKPHECKQCNCNLHSEQCHFDAARFAQTGERSGGICDNCRHHTTGPNCEQCLPFFYMDPNRDITDPDVCVACDCELAGSLNGGVCDGITDSRNGLTAGQCRCKSNVDGARCDRCRDGYFGLNEENPDGCSPCDCDSLGTLGGGNTCDPYTGQCTCKRYTTGRRCDQCLPQTWGMSAIPNGCTECDCDIGGAYKDSCELVSGQCDCRPNIEGRRCDVVVPGFFLPGLDYYVFEAEDGDYSGSIEEAKDYREHRPPVTWTGDGFLMVQEDNSVTFIVRDLPQSRNYDLVLRYQTNMPQDWQYVEVEIDRPNRGNIPTSSPCGNTMPNDDSWVVSLPGPPATFHSLGIICLEENYTYRIKVDFKRYQQNSGYDDPTPDILIDSLVVVPLYQDLYMFQSSVEGHERAKMFEDLGCQDDEMIMPNRDPGRDCASLMFSMSAVVHDGAQDCDCDPHGSLSSTCDPWNGQCVCQQNVIGRKCDRCAPGTYGFSPEGCRPCECDMQGSLNQFCDDITGKCTCRPRVTGRTCDKCLPSYFQFPQCMACSCNGHADICTPDYGVCINCRDHTVGEHCEMCENGYYGSPLLGSDEQCRPCMCPDGPNSNRQFATGCRKDEFSSRVVCFCKPGYTGSRCDQCASSYWGNPQDSNGICRKCDCSGNVDESDENACDADTGICTGCLYNTAGIHCERCRDFYYGSASERTCTSCSCNSDGTLDSTCVGDDCRCDAGTGQCQCLPRVAGRRCDQCEPNHWNLESGTGCETCNCNLENSKGPSCDEFTGQCQCNEGFGGRTCDGCADGFYGDPNVQCFASYDICGEDEIIGEKGYLTSPNFPGNYSYNLFCSKVITSPPGKRVEIFFLMMDIEQDMDCVYVYDNLTITVGDQMYSGASFCGNHQANNFTTEKDVKFTFETDDETTAQGFQIYWEMVEDCKKGFFRCWDGSCIPLSKHCDGISDCSQNDDEVECAHNPSFYGQCGKNLDAVQFTWDPRIVGGSRAISGSYSWMVPLYHYEKVDAELVSIFFCGSTILSERWILTAAHCVSWAPGRPGDLFGLLGTIDRTNFNSTKVYFDKVVVHPEYNNATQTNDIALLHTNKTITFNEAVTPICIPHQEYPILENETCITIGWGDLYSSYGGKFTDLLRQVRVEIVDQQTCERTYGGIREIQITNNHICAGNGGRDACNGDSGGPLLCLKDNSWFQFGVTSSGHGCGDAEYPGVYTDVRRYFNWIQQESSPEQTIDICGDDETQGYSGFLTSPNFPQNYGNYHDCSKLLSPPVGKRVEISFLIFELEDDDGTEEGRCLYDSLTIVVGEEQFSGVRYCGNVAPYNFTTNQEVMFNFVVDHSKTRQGFQIFWKMVDDCNERSYRCWDGSCIPASKRCDGVPDCPNQTDEIECVHPTSSYGECGKNSAPAQFVWEKKTNRRQSLLQRKSRIVGGHSARSKSYPWTVPLFFKNETSQKYICVASIISDRWLMTAAHCVNRRIARDLFGLLGTNDKSDFNSTKVQFDKIVTHPDFDESLVFWRDDIALLRTTQPITFDDKVGPVCIPNKDVPQSDICIVVGWGLFYKGSTRYPDLLHQTTLPLLNHSFCRRAYPLKMEGQICAGDFESGGRDACQGDSGGPLLCFQNNSWFQFGVTSIGSGCGRAQRPGIYTNVRSYYNWIQQESSPEQTIGDSRRKPIAVSGTRTERQMRLLMCARGGNGRYVITRCESYFNNKNEYQFCKRMKKQRRQGECKKSRKQQSQRKIGRKITDV